MKMRQKAGTTLIELLVVIVVFAVGILAFVQIFPGGLGVLRDTRAMTVGRLMVRSEAQRLSGLENQLPEYISAVTYVGGAVLPDANVDTRDLLPPLDNPAAGQGLLAQDGTVIVGGDPVGNWQKVSGAAKVSRVIGEGRPVPSPSPALDPLLYGSVMNLTFSPIYYFRDSGTGVGTGGLVLGYTNDLEVRPGNRDAGFPDPVAGLYEPWVAHYVPGYLAAGAGQVFQGEDQVWVNPLQVGGSVYVHDLRLQLSFLYDFGGEVRPVEIVIPVGYAAAVGTTIQEVGNYFVVSLPRLVDSLPDYTGANYRGLLSDAMRIQRLYREVPLGAAFTADPLQYKVANNSLGTLIVNPAAAALRVAPAGGVERPVSFKVDYTVYDWRVIKDEFTVPEEGAATTTDVKLILNQIKPASSVGPDGRQWGGLGGVAPDNSLWTPGANLTVASQDFILMDVATGAVVIGNTDAVAESAYVVNKSLGVMTFRDTDGNASNGLTATLAFLDPTTGNTWRTEPNVRLNGRKLRALYASRDQLAVQVLKPYASYRVVQSGTAIPLQAGQVYVGGSGGWGAPNQILFPVADLGHRVNIGEVTDVTGEVRREQQYQISRLVQWGGNTYAAIDLPFSVANVPGVVPVRRVTGASLMVRALWNPAQFTLGSDQVRNFDHLKDWARTWKTAQSESFLGAK